MSFAVLRRFRPGSRMASLGMMAVLIMCAGGAFAQGVPSNTAVGSDGATPVLLGNNVGSKTAASPIAPPAQANIAPVTIVTPRANTDGPNAFKTLMDKVNSNMSANGNAAAAEREKKLAAEAAARDLAYQKEQEARDPNNREQRSNKSTASDEIIMHYEEPNDKGATPSHTFHID